MKIGLKVALGAVLIALLLQSGLMWAQKGQKDQPPPPTELTALFRDNWDPNTQTYGDKIHSDGLGPYYTVQLSGNNYTSIVRLDTDGRLVMQMVNRKVFFEFDSPVRPARSPLTCWPYSSYPDEPFYPDPPPPSFLTGVPDTDFFLFATSHELTYNGTEWVYPELPFPYFDFRTMPVDPTGKASALVRGGFNFHTVADSSRYIVGPNGSFGGPRGGSAVKVTHPSADVWIVEPQSPPQLPGDPPLSFLGPNEAGLRYEINAVKREHPGGNCDLGDWVMPFQITFTKR